MSTAEDSSRSVRCVDEVLITPELAHRPARAPDYAAENRALTTLAQEMATNPGGVLQKVAELALELCHADSVGISLLEPGGTQGIFRWQAAAGAFASHLQRAMPREASPCGIALTRNEVLLFRDAERYFPALRGMEPRLYENLLAPWHVRGEAVGALWVIGHTPEHQFDAEDARLLQSLTRFASAAYQMIRALDAAQGQEEGERRGRERTRELESANETLRREASERERAEERLRRAFSIETVGVIFVELAGLIVDANEAFVRMSGYPIEDIHDGRARWDILTPPEFLPASLKAVDELARTGQSTPYEKQYIRKDGSRWWGLFAAKMLNEHEAVEFILDITARKQAEEALRESEERQAFLVRLGDALRPLADAAEIQTVAARLLGEHLHVERAFYSEHEEAAEQTRIHREYVREGTPSIAGIYRWKDYPSVREFLRGGQLRLTPDITASRFLGADEASRRVAIGLRATLSVPLVKKGNLVAVLSVAQSSPRDWTPLDVSLVQETAERTWAAVERARAEAALREGEQRFRLLVENVREYALAQIDPQGLVTSWNPGAERLFGYTSTEILGQPVSRLLTPEDQALGVFDQELAQVRAGGRQEDARWLMRQDGTRFWARWVTEPVRDEAGQFRGFAKVLRDETERQRAEEQQRLLVGELNHRVKNTLAIVQSIATQTLQRTAHPAEFVTNFTGRLQALARAHSLLTQSRWEGAEVADILCLQLALEGDGERLSCSGPPAFLAAQPALALALVLHELGTNARKYGALSVPHGQLRVTWTITSRDGESQVEMDWTECHGPAVSVPEKAGFGTALIEHSLKGSGGDAQVWFEPAGFRCRMRLPLEADQQAAGTPEEVQP